MNELTSLVLGSFLFYFVQVAKKRYNWDSKKIMFVLSVSCLVIGFVIALMTQFLPQDIIQTGAIIAKETMGTALIIYNFVKPFIPIVSNKV